VSLQKCVVKDLKVVSFFLFNDILVYGNIVIGKKKYNKQHIIPLEEVQLEGLEDNGQYRNGWLIRTTTKSFAVYAATSTEKQEWMAHISKCIEDLLRKSGKKPVENHAAVWVPDNEANVCMHCKKTQFTMLNRRHHCRNCGAVVCGPCSSKKYLLPQQSNKPVRVCLGCFDQLNKHKMDQSTNKTTLTSNQANNNTTISKPCGDSVDIINKSISGGAGNESSPDDDSDDEGEDAKQQTYDEPKFYGDGEKLDDSRDVK